MKRHTPWKVNLIIGIAFLTLVCTVGRSAKLHINHRVDVAMAQANSQIASDSAQIDDLQGENDLIREKLARAATYQTDPAVKSVSEYYINKYFGEDAELVKKVMTCESGLDNRRTHINKDGSRDMGLYQIHDEPTHRANIKKMYGVDIEIGAYDFDISSKYAKFLWDRSRYNWVCYRIVTKL